MDAVRQPLLLRETTEGAGELTLGAEEKQVGVGEVRHAPDQRLASTVLRNRSEVEDERRPGTEAEHLAEVGSLEVRVRFSRVGQVADDRRSAAQVVALLEPLGDAIGDGDHLSAAGDGESLEGGDRPPPERLTVGHSGRQLVRVVDEISADRPSADPARRKHRRIVGVDCVGPVAQEREDERGEEDSAVDDGRHAFPDPGGRRHAAHPESVEFTVELTGSPRQVEHGHLVPGVDQGPARAADPRVVLNRLVEEHRDPHWPTTIELRAMRVTFLTHYYPPEVGAPQARISALAAGLAARGEDVTVHTCFPHYPSGEIKAPHRNQLLRREREGEVRVIRSAVYPAPNHGFARRLADHLSFAGSALATAPAGGPADVVVVETPPLFLAGAAIAYARAKRACLVLNVADLWPDSAIELGALDSRLAIAGARRLERAAYRAADAIACPTEGILATLESRPESAGKAELIRPAVDLDRFDPGAPQSKLAGSGDDEASRPLRVLYAGTIGMAHGLETLADAVDLLERDPAAPTVEATIAGDGAEAPALRARIDRRGPAGVRLLGAVPSDRVPALYAESDVAVVLLRDLPIFADALPTKMLEAMASGRPVILSARGEAARLIEGAGAGLVVEPESPKDLALSLADLARDPDRRARLGAAGRAAAERQFGRGPWLERWRSLLA
jgi:glycosyltransferase involved in cell wall biosynthesis